MTPNYTGAYAACGFQIRLVRKTMQYLVQVYLPSCMFVVVSWVSFLIKPEVVPGRMALLVTLFLVLINIFNSVRYFESSTPLMKNCFPIRNEAEIKENRWGSGTDEG